MMHIGTSMAALEKGESEVTDALPSEKYIQVQLRSEQTDARWKFSFPLDGYVQFSSSIYHHALVAEALQGV